MPYAFPLLLCALVLPGASSTEVPSDGAEERVARVEAGLRPPAIFRGQPGWSLEDRMEHYGVPAVGIAVIHGGQLAWHKVYGKSDVESGGLATTETLFQAASISKPITALAALKLAAAKGLSIDEDVNAELVGWKLPTGPLTEATPVTLAHLLCHRAGTGVHGFAGYPQGASIPSTIQVLDGQAPANSPAVRVEREPNQAFSYSGGGYTIVQQWMTDVGGKPFGGLMDELILGPAGMGHSTYAQPLPKRLHPLAAAGVPPSGVPVPGKWHIYPEQAAAGLWTTAGDLAGLVIEVQAALRGESEALPKELAERVAPGDGSIGLGFFTRQQGDQIYFGHGGWNEGFSSELIAHRDAGVGAVVMTNGNQPDLIAEILQSIRVEYRWPATKVHELRPVTADVLQGYPGRYRIDAEQALILVARDGQLAYSLSGGPQVGLAHVGGGVFLDPEDGTEFTVHDTPRGPELRVPGVGVFPLLGDKERLPRELLLGGSFEQALSAYQGLQAAGALTEEKLNADAYEILGEGRLDHALLLFRMNAALYPKSANAWDSLGEGYRNLKDIPRSIEAYEQALEIDPAFPTALRALAELRGQ